MLDIIGLILSVIVIAFLVNVVLIIWSVLIKFFKKENKDNGKDI